MQTNTPPRAEYLPIEKLHPFENHPFQVKDDAEMDQLVFSVLTQGLLTPIVVRETETAGAAGDRQYHERFRHRLGEGCSAPF